MRPGHFRFRFAIRVLSAAAVFMLGFPGSAAAHLDDNLRGVPPSEPSEWNYHGISEEESREWIKEGIIFAAWAAQWKDEGFNASAAGKWHRLANVYTAGDFLKNGFGPDEAKEWMDHGIRSGVRAREYVSGGLNAREAGAFWKNGLYPDEAREWYQAGFNAEAMLEWRYGPRMSAFYFTKDAPHSRAVYDLDFARAWRDAGFRAEEAQRAAAYGFELAEAGKWKEAGFSFRETVLWKDSGFTFEEAATNRNAGLSAGEAELRRHDAAGSGDEISELSADITVRPDGSVDVVETVAIVDRPGGAYTDGYYKYAPSPGCKGSGWILHASPGLAVRAVEVNGAPGEVRRSGNALYFSRNGAPLPAGEHRIALTYTIDGLVIDQPHHDEICLAVLSGVESGNFIRNANAVVRLPKGAHVVFTDGRAGLRDRKDVTTEVEETAQGDIVRFSAARALTRNMSFSVNVGFAKGYVDQSLFKKLAAADRYQRRLLSSLLVFASGLVVVLAYYLAVWFKAGRDPRGPGTAAAEFSPPGNIDTARMRAFLKRGKADHLTAAAQLLSLARRGHLRIFESEGIYKLEMTRSGSTEVQGWERSFLDELFRERSMLILTGRSRKKQLSSAGQALKNAMKSEYRRQTSHNRRLLLPGIAVSACFVAASVAVLDIRAGDEAALPVAGYAALLATCYGLLSLLFARLLRRPADQFVHLLERLASYGRFLESSFAGLKSPAHVAPFLQQHLPYAIAAGIDVRGCMIRDGEADWYKGGSGSFDCGDFITMVKRSL